MALAYLEIKDFPSEIAPILKGATEVLSWYREGKLAENERDALLVGTNALAYGIGLGADYFAHPTFGAASDEETAERLQSAIESATPNGEGFKAFNPLLVIQIASLIIQLIKSLKS